MYDLKSKITSVSHLSLCMGLYNMNETVEYLQIFIKNKFSSFTGCPSKHDS